MGRSARSFAASRGKRPDERRAGAASHAGECLACLLSGPVVGDRARFSARRCGRLAARAVDRAPRPQRCGHFPARRTLQRGSLARCGRGREGCALEAPVGGPHVVDGRGSAHPARAHPESRARNRGGVLREVVRPCRDAGAGHGVRLSARAPRHRDRKHAEPRRSHRDRRHHGGPHALHHPTGAHDHPVGQGPALHRGGPCRRSERDHHRHPLHSAECGRAGARLCDHPHGVHDRGRCRFELSRTRHPASRRRLGRDGRRRTGGAAQGAARHHHSGA